MNVDEIEEFFSDLQFVEETHTYTVHGKVIPSVSTLIKDYYKEFDNSISEYIATRDGLTQEQVLANWKKIADDACERGDKAHIFGENYTFDRSLKPTTGLEDAIVKFWNDLPPHIIPWGVEIPMYHKKLGYSGTADILLKNVKKNSFIIGDYKTNKDLYKNYKEQTMLGRFSHMLDHPFNHYQLQLSYYQILIEQVGVPVTNRCIVWLKDDGTYAFRATENLTKELLEDLYEKAI